MYLCSVSKCSSFRPNPLHKMCFGSMFKMLRKQRSPWKWWVLPWYIPQMMSNSSEAICWNNLLMVVDRNHQQRLKRPVQRIKQGSVELIFPVSQPLCWCWIRSSRDLSTYFPGVFMPFPPKNSSVWKGRILSWRCNCCNVAGMLSFIGRTFQLFGKVCFFSAKLS